MLLYVRAWPARSMHGRIGSLRLGRDAFLRHIIGEGEPASGFVVGEEKISDGGLYVQSSRKADCKAKRQIIEPAFMLWGKTKINPQVFAPLESARNTDRSFQGTSTSPIISSLGPFGVPFLTAVESKRTHTPYSPKMRHLPLLLHQAVTRSSAEGISLRVPSTKSSKARWIILTLYCPVHLNCKSYGSGN